MNEISIGSDSTAATIAENIKNGQASCACAQAHFRGDWPIANFYAGQNFPDGKMERKSLDDTFPEQPVLVRDVSCHNVALNTAALRRVGYGDDVQDPPGGQYMRKADG
jgi:predicted amidohydrolase YtcJ